MLPSSSLDTYRPLLDSEDLAWFTKHESASREHSTPLAHKTWMKEAAWLTILEAFDTHPTLHSLVFDVDETDPDNYVFIQTRHEGDEDINELGGDPFGLDEHLQSHINDMGRNAFVAFHHKLAGATIERGHLVSAGEAVLGPKWEADRRQARLQTVLPNAPKAPRPRV